MTEPNGFVTILSSMIPRFWRRTLFLLFFFGFLISAPLAVLYTAGYRYHIGSGMILKTGMLSLESAPKGAQVLVDGVLVKEKTPAVINDILPGKHTISITKEGYLPWKKTLEVQSNQTAFASAILFLASTPTFVAPISPVLSTVTADKHAVAYVTPTQNDLDIWRLTAGENAPSPLISVRHDVSILSLEWSAQGHYLLIHTDDETRPFLIVTSEGDLLSDTESLLEAEDVWWDAGQDGFLFVKTKDTLLRLNVVSGLFDTFDRMADAARMTAQGWVILEETEGRASLTRIQNNETVILAYLPSGSYRFLPSPDGLLFLEDHARERVFLVTAEGGDQPILLQTSATQWQWNDARQLLLSDGFDLQVYDSVSHTDTLITRTSERISSAIWDATQTQIIFCLPFSLQAVEREERGARFSSLLAADLSCDELWLDEDGKTLSFFGERGEEKGWFEKYLRE